MHACVRFGFAGSESLDENPVLVLRLSLHAWRYFPMLICRRLRYGMIWPKSCRLMGYGGGIHNFKNYVLRDREEYRTAARTDFARILDVIAGIERGGELNAAEQQALKAFKAVVESYDAAVDRITELRNKGWRAEDIDRVVIIDDTAAVPGLDTLRARWTWTDLEEIEFQLGYGKANSQL